MTVPLHLPTSIYERIIAAVNRGDNHDHIETTRLSDQSPSGSAIQEFAQAMTSAANCRWKELVAELEEATDELRRHWKRSPTIPAANDRLPIMPRSLPPATPSAALLPVRVRAGGVCQQVAEIERLLAI
jgi:hypothetical protein